MAGELVLTATLQANKSPTLQNVSMSQLGIALDIAGSNFEKSTQAFTTSPTLLIIGPITTVGYVMLRNTDTVNDLLVRVGSGGADLIKIRKGGFALFESAVNNLFVSSSAGTVVAEKTIIEQ